MSSQSYDESENKLNEPFLFFHRFFDNNMEELSNKICSKEHQRTLNVESVFSKKKTGNSFFM